MAIVKVMHPACGGTIIVRDDCYRDLPREEIERRRAETARIAGEILRERAMREWRERERTAGRGPT